MRVGVYLRQSKDRDGTGLAVARQRKDCLKLCSDRGWEPVEYVDNDVSAYTGKRRPAYERMLADIEAGKLGAVCVWDLDRLHRRPIELEHFMELADRHRLALATVSGVRTFRPTFKLGGALKVPGLSGRRCEDRWVRHPLIVVA